MQFPLYKIAFLFPLNSQNYSKADVLERWQVTGNFNPNVSTYKKGKANKLFVFLNKVKLPGHQLNWKNEKQKQPPESQ